MKVAGWNGSVVFFLTYIHCLSCEFMGLGIGDRYLNRTNPGLAISKLRELWCELLSGFQTATLPTLRGYPENIYARARFQTSAGSREEGREASIRRLHAIFLHII